MRLQLPLVKNGDILRVLWFSFPFYLVAVGLFLDSMFLRQKRVVYGIFFGSIGLVTFVSLMIVPEFTEVSAFHFLYIGLFTFTSFALIFVSIFPQLKIGDNLQRFIVTSFCLLVLLAFLPTSQRVLGLSYKSCSGTQYSAEKHLAYFNPIEMLMHIDRSARVATELHTHLGHDLRLSKFELFSAARAIVVDRAFGANLEEKI